jgi:hypothetical protein
MMSTKMRMMMIIATQSNNKTKIMLILRMTLHSIRTCFGRSAKKSMVMDSKR